MRDTSPWLGTWHFDASAAEYGRRPAPRSGVYTIEQHGKALHFLVNWVDHEGKERNTSFSIVPDGRPNELDNGSTMVATLNPLGLVTAARRGDTVIHLAHRTLLDDGNTMRIVQEGLSSGRPWRTVSIYRR